MTREELTKEIAKRVKDIRNLYYSVYPEGDTVHTTLHITFSKDVIEIYHGEDKNYPIDYYEDRYCIGINGVWEDK